MFYTGFTILLSKRPPIGFLDQLTLNAGRKYRRTFLKSKVLQNGPILQYFRYLLSHLLSFRFLLCIFLSGHFTQVLLYIEKTNAILFHGVWLPETFKAPGNRCICG